MIDQDTKQDKMSALVMALGVISLILACIMWALVNVVNVLENIVLALE